MSSNTGMYGSTCLPFSWLSFFCLSYFAANCLFSIFFLSSLLFFSNIFIIPLVMGLVSFFATVFDRATAFKQGVWCSSTWIEAPIATAQLSKGNAVFCCYPGKHVGKNMGLAWSMNGASTGSKDDCTPCSMGSYTNDLNVQTTCTQCPEGAFFCSPSSCQNQSLFSPHLLFLIVLKISGYFQSEQGKTACEKCGSGKHQSLTGQASCHECVVGRFLEAVAYETPYPSDCEDCPAGYYQGEEVQTYCFPCLTGTFQNETGRSLCKDCPLGFSNGKTQEESCTTCQQGKYQDVSTQASCKGTYVFFMARV